MSGRWHMGDSRRAGKYVGPQGDARAWRSSRRRVPLLKVPGGVLNFRDTPLLLAVDPFGDTMFNRFPIERQLPREVAYLRQHTGLDEMLDELERLMAFATERVHRYLVRWGLTQQPGVMPLSGPAGYAAQRPCRMS